MSDTTFTSPDFQRRVRAVLGDRYNPDLGFTEENMRMLAAHDAFRPDAVGPWNDTPIPGLREQLARLQGIRAELEKVRDVFRTLKLTNWANGISNMVGILDEFIDPLQRKVERDSNR